ncbi:MAG: DUF1924 domain-containing protein [Campylobacterales bacterium]
MKKLLLTAVSAALLWGQNPNAESLLNEFKTQGGGPFDAKRGEAAWMQENLIKGEKMSCVTCHGKDLTQGGKHYTSGEAIDPMAPSVTKTRFSDLKHTRKWFKRNCKEVYGRECTPQEKGDFMLFILSK